MRVVNPWLGPEYGFPATGKRLPLLDAPPMIWFRNLDFQDLLSLKVTFEDFVCRLRDDNIVVKGIGFIIIRKKVVNRRGSGGYTGLLHRSSRSQVKNARIANSSMNR